MPRAPALLVLFLLLLALLVAVLPARAQGEADGFAARVRALATDDFGEKLEAVRALAATGDPRAAPVLEALIEGDLHVREADGAVVIARKVGRDLALTSPLTGEPLGSVGRRDTERLRVNNRLRGEIRAALAGLTLLSPDPGVRAKAAGALLHSRDEDQLAPLEQAIEAEQDPEALGRMRLARAAILAARSDDLGERIEAVEELAGATDPEVRAILGAILAEADLDPALAEAAGRGLERIERRLWLLGLAENVFQGVSLGGVLLLAATGLAITFGVMGVINMAHGEMVMLGAYTTFVVQELFRAYAPDAFGWSLAAALPLAFLVAGAVGVAIERGVIRFLYGRPLETLLATFGLSLVLQQAVRSIFGPTNRQVGTPDWMRGAFEVAGGVTLTANRIAIILFALAVFAALLVLLRATPFGLRMRAVTQNRPMASAMGIRTGWLDAMTFGLGSGIAGVAGIALSQIDNVSPNLGQGYIIDSFMVVVFGGVGNLWGTLVAALTLGVANKFLEPFAGAVLGKILVLVFIILFIQRRPRGLFALRGRAAEG